MILLTLFFWWFIINLLKALLKGNVKMKETIYTIPINEAFDPESFCPFCYMHKKLEEDAIAYTLGPAMMEVDFRLITNEKGFCQKHIRELGAESKALPLSLVFDSHLSEIEKLFDIDFSSKSGLFSKKEDGKKIFSESMQKLSSSCAVCSRIENTFSHYIKSFFYMLKKENGFLEKVLSSDGFCMDHFAKLAQSASDILSDSEYQKLFVPIINLQKKRIEEYHHHINSFSQSFDYRNAGKKADFPKDILHKTSTLLNGEFTPKPKKLDNI